MWGQYIFGTVKKVGRGVNMRQMIEQKLALIEQKYDIIIILAVESGSRAWGFESLNSDWDVRFIYINRPEWYLTVFPGRDVIEDMDGDLDFSGWDLRKALGLLYKSNPPLLEWLKSPIVYREHPAAASALRKLALPHYDPKHAIYHYNSMAGHNWTAYIKGKEEVCIKKYLYIFRPLLSCKHIEIACEAPPMEIDKLLVYLEEPTLSQFNQLLEQKKNGQELGNTPANPLFNEWIEKTLTYYEDYAQTLEKKCADTANIDSYLNHWIYAVRK